MLRSTTDPLGNRSVGNDVRKIAELIKEDDFISQYPVGVKSPSAAGIMFDVLTTCPTGDFISRITTASLSASRLITFPDANLTFNNGGILDLGGYTLTVPMTGTAVVSDATDIISSSQIIIQINDSGSSTIVHPLTVTHMTSTSTPSIGFGVGINLNMENTTGSSMTAGRVEAMWYSGPTAGSENSLILFKSLYGGDEYSLCSLYESASNLVALSFPTNATIYVSDTLYVTGTYGPDEASMIVQKDISAAGTITAKQLIKAGISLDPNSATGNYTLALSPSSLSANRRATFPNADGTVVLGTGIGTIAWPAGGATLTIPATGTAAIATGLSGGQTIYGGTDANDDLTLKGTSHATKTTSYVILQPNGGNVAIGKSTAAQKLEVGGSIRATATDYQYGIELYCDLGGRGFYVATTDYIYNTSGTKFNFNMGSATGDTYVTLQTLYLGTTPRNLVLNYLGGNVVIGTTVSTGKLHVDQSSTTGAIPVLTLDQADVSEEFERYIGTAAAATLTQSLVDVGDVATFTVVGYRKVYIQDDGNQITDGYYYVPFGTLA